MCPQPDVAEPASEKSRLELDLLRNEVAKLSLEVEAMRGSRWWDRVIGSYLPLLTAFGAVVGFWFGVYQFHGQQVAAVVDRTEELKREAAKPFWDTQLSLYIQAVNAAAEIATSDDEAKRKSAESEFWLLYWGPLSCVEDMGVGEKKGAAIEGAMVEFGTYLEQHTGSSRKKEQLQPLALELAHAIRDEIAPSFDLVPATLPKRQPWANLRV